MLTRRALVRAAASLTAVAATGCRPGGPHDAGATGVTGVGATATTGGPDLTTPVDPALVPDVAPGPVLTGSFVSVDRQGADVAWSLIRPPGANGRLPLVVALHGHGGSTGQLLTQWQLPRFLAAAVAAGSPSFSVATVNGGDTFWHPRPWGEDAGAMVVDELLPLLARHGVPTQRVALLGWSMGGYGALRLAGLLGPTRVSAVCAVSPGLYTDPALAHPDGFTDAAEYERFSVMDRQDDLAGIPVRLEAGRDDYFVDADHAYVAGFPPGADLTVTFDDGAHTVDYGLAHLPADLAWLGAHLPDAGPDAG